MIELPVTLSDNGAAVLPGYAYALALGYAHMRCVSSRRASGRGLPSGQSGIQPQANRRPAPLW